MNKLRVGLRMFRELWGNTMVLLFAFWSGFTTYALLDHRWLRYIEPDPWIAWTELVMACLIIPLGLYLAYHDTRYGIYRSVYEYVKEILTDTLVVGFGVWSLSTFWEITHVGWSEYAAWPTWASLAWFSAAELMFFLGIERWGDDLQRFRRLYGRG